MEHLATDEALRAVIEVARALLAGAPDGGSARHGFDLQLRAHVDDDPCEQRIVALAAAELHRTLRHPAHRAKIIDEFRSHTLLMLPGQDGRDQLKVVQAALRTMRRELNRAARQAPADMDVFLRTEPGRTWEGWTRHLLQAAAGTQLPVAGPDDRHPGLTEWHYQQLCAGDEVMWARLVEVYQATMQRFVRRCGVPDAETDRVVAKAFAKARDRAVTRGRGKGGLRGERPHSVYRWLRRVAYSTAMDHHRTVGRRRAREQAALRDPSAPNPTSDSALHVDPQRLSQALITVVNVHLAPIAGGPTDSAIPALDRGDLPDALVSPELARRVRNAEHDRRLVLVAAIHLLLRLGPDDLDQTATGVDEVVQASSETRTSFQLSRLLHDQPGVPGKPDPDAPNEAATRPQRNTGAESHQSRRNAPSVLYAAQRALRAWLEHTPRPAATDLGDAPVWLLLWQAERSMLIGQLVAISEQLAGSLSTLRAFSPARCEALGEWASDLLAELEAVLAPEADGQTDLPPLASVDPELDKAFRTRIRTTIAQLITRFERPPIAAIDRHRAALTDPDGSLAHGDRIRLQTAVDHYQQLREVHDPSPAPAKTANEQPAHQTNDPLGSSLRSDQEVQP